MTDGSPVTGSRAELQPRGDRQTAAVLASGANMTGLGLGPPIAGLFAEYVAAPTRTVFWVYLGLCALTLAALAAIPETVQDPDRRISLRPGLDAPTESPLSRRSSHYAPSWLGKLPVFTRLSCSRSPPRPRSRTTGTGTSQAASKPRCTWAA